MIKNHNEIADHIAQWIKGYVKNAMTNGVVLGLSGGIDSALVALLCKRGNVQVFCVNMPCHSSGAAYERASEFAKEHDLHFLKVDLSAAHESIEGQFLNQGLLPISSAEAALRSCLRAPTLSFYAHSLNCLIVGTGNRSEDNVTRYYQKFGDGCVDFSPIADLFKSEVYDLFKWLATDGGTKPMGPASQAIYDARPSADLWGPNSGQEDEKELGLTYDEIEWGDRENTLTARTFGSEEGILFSDISPSDQPSWSSYTPRQQVIISTMHRMEKSSRHKANPNLPVCQVRWKAGAIY